MNINRNNKMRSALSVLLSLMLTAGSAAFAYADVADDPDSAAGQPRTLLVPEEEGQPEASTLPEADGQPENTLSPEEEGVLTHLLFSAVDAAGEAGADGMADGTGVAKADEAGAAGGTGTADADFSDSDEDRPDPAEGFNGDVYLPDEDTEYNGYIVKLTRDSEVGESDEGELVLASEEGDEIPVSDVDEEDIILETEDGEVRLTHVHDDLYTVESLSDVELLDQANLVDCAEPDAVMYVMEDPDPVTTYVDDGWGQKFMQSAAYNNAGITGAGIRVGVIDGGVDLDNPNLSQIVAAGRVEDGRDFKASGDTPVPGVTHRLDFNHGVCVAQVIAGNNDASTSATSGIAPGVTIVPLKVFDDRSTSASVVISAIYAAVDDYDCDLINLSVGANGDIDFLREACQYARNNDVLVVVASGNISTSEGITKQTVMYPAAYPEVIAVGNVALDTVGTVSVSYSSVEKNVFISAPGHRLIFTDYEDSSGEYIDIYNSGTSFSTPAVTAAAALMLQAAGGRHSLTCDELISGLRDRAYRGSLLNGVTYNEANLKRDAGFGYGVLRVSNLFDTPYYYFREAQTDTSVSHALTRSGTNFTLDLSGVDDANLANITMKGWTGANRVVAAATYDSNGKLLTFTNMPAFEAGRVEASTLSPVITADTARIRCFLLDKTSLAPSSTKMYVNVNVTH